MSEVIGMESTVDFTKPSSGCVFPQGSGDIIFVFITAGETESATLKFLNGTTPEDPMLAIPIKVPAGNSQAFDFSIGSLNYYDGLYAILLGDGAQASIKVVHHEF